MEIVEDLLNILDRFIECPICQENFTDPTTLTCGHSYCIECIRKLFKHRKKTKTCPDCRAPILNGMRLHKSIALCNIVKVVWDHKSFVSNEVSSNAEREFNVTSGFDETSTLSPNLACDPGTGSDAHIVHLREVAVPASAANAEGATGDVPLDTDLSERLSQDLAIGQPLQDNHRAEDFPPPLPGATFAFLTFTPALGQRGLGFKTAGKVVVTKSSAGRHNDRFRISQWLAEQQLSEGLHYWDVDTTGSQGWAVGVAYDTIGWDDQLGRTACSWCLEGGKESLSYWHDGNEEPLKHEKPRLVRVAVSVDVTGGSLSFYSLEDDQTLLYCVNPNGGFSQPVRPAFWLYGLKLHNSLSFPRRNDAL